MTKTISSANQTHLEQTVTTLAMCWHITRTDGTEFFFTNHDNDLVVSGDTYVSAYGFEQTAIANDSSMAVDNLDVMGILDNSQIKESELRAGLFDFADVEIFIVNYESISDGIIKMRKGWLGEVIVSPNGTFKTELRGLTQALSQSIVEVYTPDCRADLGDSRCKVPIDPSLRLNSTAYALGDTVKVDTASGIGQDMYENVYYEATTAGTSASAVPVFDPTVGNTTTDGTVVWTARNAWTRNFIVTGITDRRIITIDVDEDRAVDDWFNYGVIKFESGLNVNLSREVKDWVQSTKTVTLFLAFPFDIQVGDQGAIYPGCDKRKATCISKFNNINNFRGEPYVPGSDEFFNYPDSR